MGKHVMMRCFLLLLSIFLLVASPLISAFTTGSAHLHSANSRHNHHITNAYLHSSSWSIISNRQLTAPPHGITLKNIGFLLFCAGFLCFTLSIRTQTVKVWLHCYAIIPPPGHLYLLVRSLLI